MRDPKRSAIRRLGRKIQIKEGWLVGIEFSAKGGVTYERENIREEAIGDKGAETEIKTVKRVDNVDLHKESKAVIGAAYYVMDRYCVSTPLGYFADDEQLKAAEAQIADIRIAAGHVNDMARLLGSARRVTIETYPIELSVDNEKAARRLAKVVRERLTEIAETLRAGNRKTFDAAFEKARNLERLATGIQSDSVHLALAAAKELKREMLESLLNGDGPELAGAKLDLGPIHQAINLFMDPADIDSAWHESQTIN